MRLFYSADYVASGTDFDTTRKAKWVADSLEQSPIAGVQIVAPVSLTAEQVAAEDARFDLCMYNAGMDPFERSYIGGLHGITREILSMRERAVFEWCRRRGLPVAFVLAGGYTGPRLDVAELVELHRLTVSAAVQASRNPDAHLRALNSGCCCPVPRACLQFM